MSQFEKYLNSWTAKRAPNPKADLFIDDQFPVKSRAHLPTALQTAYESVGALAKDTPFLALPSAQLGHLRAWACELAIKRLIDSGKLPYDYDWQPYKNGTGNWLRVRLSHSVLSVHQLVDATKTPRKADYRNNGFFNNQGVFDLPELVEDTRLRGLPHLVLTHGHNELSFAHVGLPKLKGKGYFARTPNLMATLHVVESDVPPLEGVGIEPTVELHRSKEVAELKDEIVRLLKDSK